MVILIVDLKMVTLSNSISKKDISKTILISISCLRLVIQRLVSSLLSLRHLPLSCTFIIPQLFLPRFHSDKCNNIHLGGNNERLRFLGCKECNRPSISRLTMVERLRFIRKINMEILKLRWRIQIQRGRYRILLEQSIALNGHLGFLPSN